MATHQRVRGCGQHRLSAVCRGSYPSRPVHVHPDIAVLVSVRLTRMKTHPYPQRNVVGPRVLLKATLPLPRSEQRMLRRSEDDEEAVALGAHLMAVVRIEGCAQDRPLRRQRLGPTVAQPV